jgi:hypothetical protein
LKMPPPSAVAVTVAEPVAAALAPLPDSMHWQPSASRS